MLALPFLLEICLFSPWSPPFPLCAPALIPLTLAKVRLSPTLTLSSLMIWYSGLTALFLIFLATAAPAYMPTAFSVALRLLVPFRQAQYAQVFPLKPAPFCTLFADLGNTKSLPLLLADSRSVLFVYLKLCGRNCLLSPVLSYYNGSLDTCFSRGTTRLMSWPDKERYLHPLQSLVVSLLLPLEWTLFLFSNYRRTVLSKFFDTQVPSTSTEELVFPRLACCVLIIYAATDTAFG